MHVAPKVTQLKLSERDTINGRASCQKFPYIFIREKQNFISLINARFNYPLLYFSLSVTISFYVKLSRVDGPPC